MNVQNYARNYKLLLLSFIQPFRYRVEQWIVRFTLSRKKRVFSLSFKLLAIEDTNSGAVEEHVQSEVVTKAGPLDNICPEYCSHC